MLYLVTLALIIVELTDGQANGQANGQKEHSVWSAMPSTACYIQLHKVNIPFFLPYF